MPCRLEPAAAARLVAGAARFSGPTGNRYSFQKVTAAMETVVENSFEFLHELRREADLSGMPLSSQGAGQDVAELIDEAYTLGVLGERFLEGCDRLRVELQPVWTEQPVVKELAITLTADPSGETLTSRFAAGRWLRSCQTTALELREAGVLGEGQTAHSMLLALRRRQPPALELPPLAPPPWSEQPLEALGIRRLADGTLDPDRPVLISQRLVRETIERCEASDTTETGAAVLGKLLRLPQPLPGTSTRFVTVLTALVDDPRHQGEPLSFHFSPAGLADAAQFADVRGLGEHVLTVWHSHGWSKACGNCNQNANCPLAECKPSLQDYVLLESLLSSKATLLPITGRKLGAEGRRPVLRLYAWRGGRLRPIGWQEYVP
ncbi:MAG: hypothetical protein J5I93_11970 [Pirellulaceae bacterium]|nr:hypothetical protein [Pirellulaceae bacterium]